MTISGLMERETHPPFSLLAEMEGHFSRERQQWDLAILPFLPNNLYHTQLVIISIFSFTWPYFEIRKSEE